MRLRILLILGVLLLGRGMYVRGDVIYTYNPTTDFSTTENPNGVWSYGYCDPEIGVTTFTEFEYLVDWTGRTESLPAIKAWQRGFDASNGMDPSVTYNDSSEPVIGYGYTWQPYSLVLDSFDGLSPIVRWQAPEAGTVDISATFSNIGPSYTTAYVFYGNEMLWSEWTDYGNVSYSNSNTPLAVNSGDFIYLATSGVRGSLTQLDAVITLTAAGSSPIPGDANNDKKVDGSDVTILAGNWQTMTGATWDMGDFNGDGKVDGSDVTILAGNWQAGVTTAAASVPEPSTIFLILGGMFSVLVIRRKR